MRVVAFIVFAGLMGVATGLVLQRVIVGVLVGAGLLVLGLVILISRSGPLEREPEPYDTSPHGRPDSGER